MFFCLNLMTGHKGVLAVAALSNITLSFYVTYSDSHG